MLPTHLCQLAKWQTPGRIPGTSKCCGLSYVGLSESVTGHIPSHGSASGPVASCIPYSQHLNPPGTGHGTTTSSYLLAETGPSGNRVGTEKAIGLKDMSVVNYKIN